MSFAYSLVNIPGLVSLLFSACLSTVGTSVFHQAPQCSGFGRLYSPCAGPVADAFAPIRETRPVMRYSVRPCRKTCCHGLPRVSSRRYVSCITSFHRVVSWVPSCRHQGASPADVYRIAQGASPVNPFFQIFFAAACDLDEPHFRQTETDSKMSYARYNEGTASRLPLMFTNTDHLFTHTVSKSRCKLFVKCVTFS